MRLYMVGLAAPFCEYLDVAKFPSQAGCVTFVNLSLGQLLPIVGGVWPLNGN